VNANALSRRAIFHQFTGTHTTRDMHIRELVKNGPA